MADADRLQTCLEDAVVDASPSTPPPRCILDAHLTQFGPGVRTIQRLITDTTTPTTTGATPPSDGQGA
jgi:hypothetical protein